MPQRFDRIKNEIIRGTVYNESGIHILQVQERRLKWDGDVMRRNDE